MDIVRNGMVVGGSVVVRAAHPVALVKMMCVMVTADSRQGRRWVHGHLDKLKLFDSKLFCFFGVGAKLEAKLLYVSHLNRSHITLAIVSVQLNSH